MRSFSSHFNIVKRSTIVFVYIYIYFFFFCNINLEISRKSMNKLTLRLAKEHGVYFPNCHDSFFNWNFIFLNKLHSLVSFVS